MFQNEDEFNRLVTKLPIDTRVDPAHKEATRQRMLEQFAQARQTPPPAASEGPLGWMRRLSVKTKSFAALAAVLAITAGIIAVVYFGGGAKIALADVQRKLAAVPVIAFRLELFRPGVTPLDAQTYVTEDSITRFELPECTSLIDWQHGRMLALMPQSHEAIEGDVQNLQENPYHRDWLADLRRIVGCEDARYLGTKTVDGVHAVGWEINDGNWIVTVWADADSAELVRVEFQKDQLRMAFSRFRYDVDIDPGKLSLTAPAGYTVRRIAMDASRASEGEVVLVLRIWAMGNGDVFPDSLDSWKFSQAASKADWEKVMEEADGKSSDEISQSIGQAFWWLNTNPGWSYVGAGVRLGDAKKAVFWYRPQGTSTWRVIYGDLRVETADAPPRQ
ncbi:MAG: hypothetical protein MUP47_08065 [Phycisphaerae bacterium]|nr:hypothetical protein [Phycisphaerae bacterium]